MVKKELTSSKDYRLLYEQEKEAHLKTKIKLAARRNELHHITKSHSYRLAKGLALSKHALRVAVNHLKALNPFRMYVLWKNKRSVSEGYTSTDFTAPLQASATSDFAVILHLFYPEMFPFFVEKLQRLPFKYDLYVSLPQNKNDFRNTILKEYPNARVVLVPNCGRDVLPFVKIMQSIEDKGYVKFLKLHSKKSPHRRDGATWRDGMVDALIPSDKRVINDLILKLDDPHVAIIGPAREYVSLLVNLSATSHHLIRMLQRIYGSKDAVDMIVNKPDEYGFFSGTMFWARADAIRSVIDAVDASLFEPERGQVDSTFAHALERLLNIVPEFDGRKMYGVSEKAVVEQDYHTTRIPNWAEFKIEEEAED